MYNTINPVPTLGAMNREKTSGRNEALLPVILSGGAGRRLWPLSRAEHPKPFLRLGPEGSLLEQTFGRAAALSGVTMVLTVTHQELVFKTCDAYEAVNSTRLATPFLLEPLARNTGPSLAAAALWAERRLGAGTVLLALPADHFIRDEAAFARAVDAAITLAESGRLVAFGIRPVGPETRYGYLEVEGSRVVRFVEKPTEALAREFVQSGRFLWNAGIFCMRADVFLAELAAHAPDLLAAVRAAVVHAPGFGAGADSVTLDAGAFAAAPDLSIDYALMERSQRVAVVPGNFGWADVGSWSALAELTNPDAHGNRISGEVHALDSENCYVWCPRRLAALVGVRDLIVVDTEDALLVAHRDRVDEVKGIVSDLTAAGHESALRHREVHRPWGSYTVLEEGPRFKIKRLVVKPRHALSLQMHHHRSEHWVVVAGTAEVQNGEGKTLLSTDESTYIPAGTRHRLANPGLVNLVVIEVQSGEYLGEDDIVRFDDAWGRA